MIEYYKKTIRKKELQRLSGFAKDCWINVVDPSEEEVESLVDKFKLEKNLLMDGLDIYELPRIEEENHKAYLYLRMPTSRVTNEYTSSFLVIVSNNFFMTVSNSKLELVEKILKTRKDFLTNNINRSLLQILLFLSNRYNLKIRKILKEVKRDRRNLKNLREDDIHDLVIQEDILNDYLLSFNPLIHLHSSILKLRSVKFREDEKEFIEDLIIDLNQTLNSCKSALSTITNMRDYYSTTVSNRLNKTLKILTVFTVFLTIPTLLASIYGMNVDLPFQDHSHFVEWSVGIVLLIWTIIFIGFKKKDVF